MADRLRGIDESLGAADPADFDGLDGAEYVDRHRSGLERRLRKLDAE